MSPSPVRRACLAGLLGAPAWAGAQDRVLRLVNAPYPPFVLPVGDPMGEGMDIEIARAALARGVPGATVELGLMPWRRVLLLLNSGEADLTTTISRNEDRERFLLFTEGYRHEVRYHVYTRMRDGLQIERLADLRPLTLGIAAGFFYPAALRKATAQPLVEAKDLETAVRMLNAGRTDAIVLNHLAGAWQVRRLGLEAVLQRQPFHYTSGSPTYMAVARARPGAEELRAALNRGLLALQADGGQARIEKRYLG